MLTSRTRGEFLIVLIACLFGAQLFFSLALAAEKTPAKAITDACNPGEVHTIKQAAKGSAPLPTKVACFARSSAGTTAYTSSATTDRSCQLSRADSCVIQYCPPKDALRSGKEGTCFVVSCGNVSGTECLKQTMATATKEGPAGVARKTLLEDFKRAAITPGEGAINGKEFLTQVLNPELAKELRRSSETPGAPIDKIKQIADAIEKGTPPCTGASCTPTLQLNKDLVDAQARLQPPMGPGSQSPGPTGKDEDRPTLKLPGGPGKSPPPVPQPNPPSQQSFPQPTPVLQPTGECKGGTWQPQYGQSSAVIGWICAGGKDTGPKPNIILVTDPEPPKIKSGETAKIGWITTGMKECTISSPQLENFTKTHKDNKSKNGMVKTPALEKSADFELKCEAENGEKSTKKVRVEVEGDTGDEVAVSYSYAQFAGLLLATLLKAEPVGKAAPVSKAAPVGKKEYACNPGQVHLISQDRKVSEPRVAQSQCYIRNSSTGAMERNAAEKGTACVVMPKEMADQCIVVNCPPKDALGPGGKAGICYVVNCGAEGGVACLAGTIANLKKSDGHLIVAARTLANAPTTAAIVTNPDGTLDVSKSIADAFDKKQLADYVRANAPAGSEAFDRIAKIANDIEKGSLPAPVLKLNEELAKATIRLGPPFSPTDARPGPGDPTGPAAPDNTGFKFPNIQKDPSGTDVFAWAKHLMGLDKPPQQPQQNPLNQGGTNLPEPPAEQCKEGKWEPIKSGETVSAWRCVRTTITLRAVPEAVESGKTANIGWFTDDDAMQSCMISSEAFPEWTKQNESYKHTSGALKSPPLSKDATFVLECTTKAGAKEKKELIVRVI